MKGDEVTGFSDVQIQLERSTTSKEVQTGVLLLKGTSPRVGILSEMYLILGNDTL